MKKNIYICEGNELQHVAFVIELYAVKIVRSVLNLKYASDI